MSDRRLSVAVHGQAVADLIEHDGGDKGYSLVYLSHTRPEEFVCLSLRELKTHADFQEVPAIFQQFLPEGALRVWVDDVFKKSLGVSSDFDLVEAIGPYARGRVSILGAGSGSTPQRINLNDIVKAKGTYDLFHDYLKTLGLAGAAVSGVQPKVVAAVDNRMTATLDDVIVKFQPRAGSLGGAPDREWPGLAINEYFCLAAARRGGLATAECTLSEDGERLIVRRFDLPHGRPALGFEDACTVQELGPAHKYFGNYESVFRALLDWTRGQHRLSGRETLFRLLVLNCLVGNGDAHRKNHALLYSSLDDIAIAPVFDIVSTLVYQPHDVPALLLRKDSTIKEWPNRSTLERFGKEVLQLELRTMHEAFAELAAAVTDTITEFREYARNGPAIARPIAEDDARIRSLPKLWEANLQRFV